MVCEDAFILSSGVDEHKDAFGKSVLPASRLGLA